MRQIVTRRLGASLDEIEGVYRERAVEYERVAAAIVHDREVARDVVQDAFATVVRKRVRFSGRGPLDAWIWRVVVNTALGRLQTNRRRSALRAAQLAPLNGRDVEGPRDARLRAELAELPQRQRLVVFLRYYADLDYATIGAALGVSTGTVASTLNSAHDRLRRQLVEEVQQ
jgi:RNA polymerase sigma factor (sigma-70 family)